ncbi:hypothetical protein [Hydrogenophaga sp. BPS33]|uniref:hypothetical protein n=1 Tax=Hydrogenophaga sp. BPS33 TaxID=2651974 RepID=UPI001320224F|nr:hypothetical protein [Hydrogenophaga sp. BPS33]QHE88585.1 hypothetical protein F9K07_28725 [Hydrogenophaga sp. BPS33]
MSEAIQKRRRTNRARELLAGLAVTTALAVALAVAAEVLISLTGLALGDGHWHRTWRDTVLLALLLFVPCLWMGQRIGPVLIASYDDEALHPAPHANMGLQWAGPLGPTQQKAWDDLSAWAQAGMGDGHSPFWRPWVLPDVDERFNVAVMEGDSGGGKSHLAGSFARFLDGNDELALHAGASKLKAWRYKLLVKWRELWWWRKRHPRQPWDSGYLVEDPAALAQLAHFRPRRPTLILADGLSGRSLEEALRALSAARVDYRHPVRLLVIDVALPSVMALGLDHESGQWKTSVIDLGPAVRRIA